MGPRRRALEALVHSLLAAGYCRLHGTELVHVHAIGPGLVVPLLRLMGLKVVFTHHGADYQRQKWGWLARRMLMLGERLAVRYADQVIVISAGIEALVRQRYGRRDAHLIPNGVCAPAPLAPDSPGYAGDIRTAGREIPGGRRTLCRRERTARPDRRLPPQQRHATAGAGGRCRPSGCL
ncbi:glycosyltransferase family 4 protein [Edwardsiella anguillarum]|nr:glycosyltransferase family 4 protein [Edwardsiella anguillarum]